MYSRERTPLHNTGRSIISNTSSRMSNYSARDMNHDQMNDNYEAATHHSRRPASNEWRHGTDYEESNMNYSNRDEIPSTNMISSIDTHEIKNENMINNRDQYENPMRYEETTARSNSSDVIRAQPSSEKRYEGYSVSDSGLSFVPNEFVPFRNIEATGRDVRRAKNDKEALEKTRLANRTGGFHKYTMEKSSLITLARGAPGYCPESDRFYTDTAGAEKLYRDEKYAHTLEITELKRLRAAEREEDRWQIMDEQSRLEEERVKYIRDFTDKGKPNLASVPYDPITLKYNDSRDGMLLKHEDDKTKYRAAVRAHHLQERMTGDGFNVITGEPMDNMRVPMKPEPLPEKAKYSTGVFRKDGSFNRSTHAGKEFIC